MIQQLELCFVLQMEGCITHHIRAQYTKTTLRCTEMKYSICSDARCKLERVLEAVSGFANPFSSIFEDNGLYFLSFSVHAKPGIDKNLIEADDIDRML